MRQSREHGHRERPIEEAERVEQADEVQRKYSTDKH